MAFFEIFVVTWPTKKERQNVITALVFPLVVFSIRILSMYIVS